MLNPIVYHLASSSSALLWSRTLSAQLGAWLTLVTQQSMLLRRIVSNRRQKGHAIPANAVVLTDLVGPHKKIKIFI